jgi:hypothetical protein
MASLCHPFALPHGLGTRPPPICDAHVKHAYSLPGRSSWEGEVRQSVQRQFSCGPGTRTPRQDEKDPPRALVGVVVVGIVMRVLGLTKLIVADVLYESSTTSQAEDEVRAGSHPLPAMPIR